MTNLVCAVHRSTEKTIHESPRNVLTVLFVQSKLQRFLTYDGVHSTGEDLIYTNPLSFIVHMWSEINFVAPYITLVGAFFIWEHTTVLCVLSVIRKWSEDTYLIKKGTSSPWTALVNFGATPAVASSLMCNVESHSPCTLSDAIKMCLRSCAQHNTKYLVYTYKDTLLSTDNNHQFTTWFARLETPCRQGLGKQKSYLESCSGFKRLIRGAMVNRPHLKEAYSTPVTKPPQDTGMTERGIGNPEDGRTWNT